MVELPVVYAMGSSGILICMKTLLEIFDECVLIFSISSIHHRRPARNSFQSF